jgi:hypothetical protein
MDHSRWTTFALPAGSIALSLLALACAKHAEVAPLPQSVSPTTQVATVESVPSRDARIRAEVKKLGVGHSWAGIYSRAESSYTDTIMVAPEAGCVVARSESASYDIDWGRVESRKGVLRLKFYASDDVAQRMQFETEYTVEGYGESKCLVARDGRRFVLVEPRLTVDDLLTDLYGTR